MPGLESDFQKLLKLKDLSSHTQLELLLSEMNISPSPAPSIYDKSIIDRFSKVVKTSILVEPHFQNTFVVAVASSKSSSDSILRINCRGGTAIGGYVYDTLNDCYCIQGIDYVTIGYVSIAFKITTKDSSWSTFIPVPESILQRYMSRKQKNDLNNFKEHYKECKISFLQLVD